MKKIKSLYILLLLPFLLMGCITEGIGDCPTGVIIRFVPKNPKHTLWKLTNTIDVYVYGEDKRLFQEYHFTTSELPTSDMVVTLPALPQGKYTFITLLNHEDCYTILDTEQLDEVNTILNNEIVETPPADLFAGIIPVKIENPYRENIIEVPVGKQTNDFKVNVIFKDYTPSVGTRVNSYIHGSNGKFIYSSYSCPPNEYHRTYLPYNQKGDIHNSKTINYDITTMRLWLGADLSLVVEENTISIDNNKKKRKVELNIADLLKQIEEVKTIPGEKFPYNTDEKLEFHDQYTIDITLGPNLVILGVVINDWTIIGGGVEV